MIERSNRHSKQVDGFKRNKSTTDRENGSTSLNLTSSPLLDQALADLKESIPDWGAVEATYSADSRNKSGDLGNMAGAAAEHILRNSLLNQLLMNARKTGDFVRTTLMPNTIAQVGRFVFFSDETTGNCVVFDPVTKQNHTEYDGVLALENVGVDRNSAGGKAQKTQRHIIVLESKLTMPRLPKNRGMKYVRKYVEHKLEPLRALFKTDNFSFVLSACKSDALTRNQLRFAQAMEEIGCKVATLGVQRSEIEAFAMSYL